MAELLLPPTAAELVERLDVMYPRLEGDTALKYSDREILWRLAQRSVVDRLVKMLAADNETLLGSVQS